MPLVEWQGESQTVEIHQRCTELSGSIWLGFCLGGNVSLLIACYPQMCPDNVQVIQVIFSLGNLKIPSGSDICNECSWSTRIYAAW